MLSAIPSVPILNSLAKCSPLIAAKPSCLDYINTVTITGICTDEQVTGPHIDLDYINTVTITGICTAVSSYSPLHQLPSLLNHSTNIFNITSILVGPSDNSEQLLQINS